LHIRDRIKDLRRVKASDLRPNPKNWRTHPKAQREALQGVLAEIGYADALLAREHEDGSLELIDGHLRAETTPEQEVPVLVLDVTAEEADKLLATLDPLAGMAGANPQQLEALITGMGITSDAVAALLHRTAKDAGVILPGAAVVEDPIPEPLPKPVSRKGDLWLLGEHRLLCGDSASASDTERLLNGAKADLVLTDPPYGVDYVGKTEQALEIQNDGAPGLGALLRGSLTVTLERTRPGAVWYVAAPAGPQFASFAEILSELGVWRQTLAWVKDSMVLGHSDYHYKHEVIFYGWSPGAAHRAPPDRTRTSVLEFERPKASREHPTMKPLALWAELLSNSTARGELVYDPFSGSGTTIIACEQLGRRGCAVEIDPRYVDVAVRRWQALTGKEATLDGNGKSWARVAAARKVLVLNKC